MNTPPYFLGMDSFALDTKRNRMVFYFPWPGPLSDGTPGVNRGETWEFTPSNNTWLKLSDTVLPAKCCFGMVYDSTNDKIVLFRGYDGHEGGVANPLNDTWVFDHEPAPPNFHKWVKLAVSGNLPSPRKGETIAYDSYNNVIVQFGGRGWDNQPDAYDIFLLRLGSGNPSSEVSAPPRNLRVQ